jgi:HAD superfamily hydrolase (TIGR01549 family)
MLSEIKHIWFDVNGTLALFNEDFNKAHDQLRYQAYAEAVGRNVDEKLKVEFEELYSRLGSNSMAFRSLGLPSDYWMNRFNILEERFPYEAKPDVYETIGKLKDLVPISIFTNNSLKGTEKIIEEIKLKREWFTDIISGDDVAERKPALHGYQLAVEKSNLPATQLLYVGDRVNTDIKPAKTVGMQTCLVYSKSDEADYSFGKLSELLNLFNYR